MHGGFTRRGSENNIRPWPQFILANGVKCWTVRPTFIQDFAWVKGPFGGDATQPPLRLTLLRVEKKPIRWSVTKI